MFPNCSEMSSPMYLNIFAALPATPVIPPPPNGTGMLRHTVNGRSPRANKRPPRTCCAPRPLPPANGNFDMASPRWAPVAPHRAIPGTAISACERATRPATSRSRGSVTPARLNALRVSISLRRTRSVMRLTGRHTGTSPLTCREICFATSPRTVLAACTAPLIEASSKPIRIATGMFAMRRSNIQSLVNCCPGILSNTRAAVRPSGVLDILRPIAPVPGTLKRIPGSKPVARATALPAGLRCNDR